ncbi:hypothetical protein DI291_21315 [Bacillus paralicheniformis]|nr:hypothetical protein BVL54_06235 [Bacillus paralicheniformis]PLC15171.1 hypothetical protein BV582_12805 [Bacillus paralicheniformis]PRS15369.1 hypothetical protein C6W27_11035 [Bacillus paralicheniformis]QEO05011.1 hypothetical protein FLQ07_04930 [Bacillus paralicheniformis]QSG00890.1 hypothetical protein DI291_21315 [Bacillus paralicheniformis]
MNEKACRANCRLQIVDKIPKRLFVLGFCHLFSVIENLCSLGRPSIGAERMLEFVSTDAQA